MYKYKNLTREIFYVDGISNTYRIKRGINILPEEVYNKNLELISYDIEHEIQKSPEEKFSNDNKCEISIDVIEIPPVVTEEPSSDSIIENLIETKQNKKISKKLGKK